MVRLEEIRDQIICCLCEGYIIDASTVTTCLHSFCRSCLIRHLVNSLHCPVCGVLIHEFNPFLNIRADPVLQRIVYKLVPGLLQDELQRREKFTASLSPSDHGETSPYNVTTFLDENISVCLKNVYHISEIHSPRSAQIENDKNAENSSLDTRYLLCPPAFTVGHLIKFIKYKFDLADHFQISVFCDEEMLFGEYTLHQVSIMHRWERASPLELYYMVYDMRKICQSNNSLVESQRIEEEDLQNEASANNDVRFKSSQNGDVTEDNCTHNDDVIGSCDKCYEKSPLKALGLVPIKSTLSSHQSSPRLNRFLKPTGKMKPRDDMDTKPFVRSLNMDFNDSGIHLQDSPLDLSRDITCDGREKLGRGNSSAFRRISRSNSQSSSFSSDLNDCRNASNESHARFRCRAETIETQFYNRQLMSTKVEEHKYDDSQNQMYYRKSDLPNRISNSYTDDINLYNPVTYDSTAVDMTRDDNGLNQAIKKENIKESFTQLPPKYSSNKDLGSRSTNHASFGSQVRETKSSDLQRRPGRLTDFTINSIISRPFVPKSPASVRTVTPVKPKFVVYNDAPSPMQDDCHQIVKKSPDLRLNKSQSSEKAFTSQDSQIYSSNKKLNLDKIKISSPSLLSSGHSSIVLQLPTEISSTPNSSAASCFGLVTPQDKIGIVIRHGRAMTLQDKLRMSSICKSKSDGSEEILGNQPESNSKVLNRSLLQTPKSELTYKRIKPDPESAENNSYMVNSPSRFGPKANSPQIKPSSAKRQRKQSHGLKMVDSNLPVSSSKGGLPPVSCFSKAGGKKKLQFEWDNNKFNRSISENVKMERKYFT